MPFVEWCGYRARNPEELYIEYETTVEACAAVERLSPFEEYLVSTRVMWGWPWDAVQAFGHALGFEASIPTARKHLNNALTKLRNDLML